MQSVPLGSTSTKKTRKKLSYTRSRESKQSPWLPLPSISTSCKVRGVHPLREISVLRGVESFMEIYAMLGNAAPMFRIVGNVVVPAVAGATVCAAGEACGEACSGMPPMMRVSHGLLELG